MFPEPAWPPGTARQPTADPEGTPYAFSWSVPGARALVRQPQPHRSQPPAAADSARLDHIVMSTVARALRDSVRDRVLLPLCRLLGRLAATTAARVTQLSRCLRKTRNVVSQPLDSHVRAVPQARRIIRTELARWGLHEYVEIAELLVSELVTNALRHARGPSSCGCPTPLMAGCCAATSPTAAPPPRPQPAHPPAPTRNTAEDCTWSTSSRPAGAHGTPPRGRPSGSNCAPAAGPAGGVCGGDADPCGYGRALDPLEAVREAAPPGRASAGRQGHRTSRPDRAQAALLPVHRPHLHPHPLPPPGVGKAENHFSRRSRWEKFATGKEIAGRRTRRTGAGGRKTMARPEVGVA